uniref:Uncharacterized protein n=1 Tax=Amphimedon queenslandica TaxID=400682 RepID=A0A1X7UUR2_AMPQE
MSTSEETFSSQSAADKIISQLEKMETSLEKEIQSISKRVRCLEEQAPQSPKRRATESSSSHWADRSTSGLDSMADCSWPVSEDEEEQGDPSEMENIDQTIPIQLSEENTKLVTSSFRKVLSSESRKRLRSAFPCPNLQDTRCPKLDSIFKGASIHRDEDIGCRINTHQGANSRPSRPLDSPPPLL